MIRPVFTNTAYVSARRGMVLKGGGWAKVDLPVRCGMFEHPDAGLVLIDAGYGPQVTSAEGRGWLLRLYNALFGPKLLPSQSPLALLAAHGYRPSDVRRVIVTHLHADHVSYLGEFSNARFVTNGQYSGSKRHGIFNELLPSDFSECADELQESQRIDAPYGLGPGYDIFEDGSVLGIPLPGHAPGHFGLCFTGDVPLLYGVDAQWMIKAITEDRAPGFPASLIASDPVASAQSAERIRAFVARGGELVLCHDPELTPYDWVPEDV